MSYEELMSVLDNCTLPNKISWTMPVLLQVTREVANEFPLNGTIGIKRKVDGNHYALFEMTGKGKIPSMEQVAMKWFGSHDIKHPGVYRFFKRGEFILSGQVFLIKKPALSASYYKLTPSQTRDIFNDLGWQNIVGFNTKSVIHKGHEFIQKKTLIKLNADAIFISPSSGPKNSGEFSVEAIIKCYETLIRKNYYNPYGVLLGTFNTYPRYCGPREKVFEAICRKNYGCNSFITFKEDSYYPFRDSLRLFDNADTGMKILHFDNPYFCLKCNAAVLECLHGRNHAKDLNDSVIREALSRESIIPQYLMQSDIAGKLQELYKISPNEVLIPAT
ncbi:MAG: hypothetical protein CMH78_07370 [Nitrospinae bacterium]|jgi:sulfate adenylyltransferase|nr:hypothetical protein [Nitrospinota bacterium]HJN01668.1 hypothetical protein [Nitrospinota bacterium]